MKLQQTTFKDGIFGAEKEMNFSIDDGNSIIFDILRDKMYSDKIGSLCREVMSNSRDANRESGRGDKSIEVEIIEPNKLTYISDMCIVFRDFGLGITPDRMANVFIKYAASTKRDTNSQTGGFGLGAKTPFAYTDTFSIVTVCNWEGKRVRYTYSAMIDSSRKGKMILFDSEEVSKDIATGTQIIVPIKESDRAEFEQKSHYYSYLWNIRPNFINFNISTDVVNEEDVITGDNFRVIKHERHTSSVLGSGKYFLNIDGIPYPLDRDQFKKLDNSGLGSQYRIILNAKVGTLTISANREAVQYDQRTKDAIAIILDEIKSVLKKELTKYISESETYLEACRRVHNIKRGNAISNDDPLAEAWAFAVRNDDYSESGMFSKERDAIFKEISKYKGKDVISKLDINHHKVMKVYMDYNDKVCYDEMSKTINNFDGKLPIYYLDTRKNVRRNITIWQKHNTPSFILIQPLSSKSVKEINADNYKMAYEYDMNINFYSDAEKAEITIDTNSKYVPNETSQIKVRTLDRFNNWESDTLEYHKKNKCFWNKRDNCKDTTQYAFVVGDSIRDPYYTIRQKDQYKLELLSRVSNMQVVFINRRSYDKYFSTSTQCFKAISIAERIIENNKERIIAHSRLSDIRDVMTDSTTESVINFAPQLLPKTLKEFKDIDDSRWNYPISAPFDAKGLRAKLQKNLNKAPMLQPYLSKFNLYNLRWKSDEEIAKHKKNINEYLKLVGI